jgi:predicted short-subunit dehydrogenase-like oxidoreductase (DUF2520 family)
MDVIVVGPGRAGGSLAIAATAAGHRLVGVLARHPGRFRPLLPWDRALPPADLAVIAVRDDAIGEVAARLAPFWDLGTVAVHLSGFTSLSALDPLSERGVGVGSLHPLQTLPDPERGAAALPGSWAAVTADAQARPVIVELAASIGLRPFDLADAAKPLYHAAASAAANYVVEALAVASDLMAAAGVAHEVLAPLTRAVVDNVFEVGPERALTGPLARGDRGTVAGQLAAASAVSAELGEQFRLLTAATARRAGLDPEEWGL